MSNEEKSFPKVGINCLPCIYTVHKWKPYKIGLFSKWDLASFTKKERKIIKNRVKYTHFWEELGYWLVALWHIILKLIKRGDDNETFKY